MSSKNDKIIYSNNTKYNLYSNLPKRVQLSEETNASFENTIASTSLTPVNMIRIWIYQLLFVDSYYYSDSLHSVIKQWLEIAGTTTNKASNNGNNCHEPLHAMNCNNSANNYNVEVSIASCDVVKDEFIVNNTNTDNTTNTTNITTTENNQLVYSLDILYNCYSNTLENTINNDNTIYTNTSYTNKSDYIMYLYEYSMNTLYN